MLIAFLLDLWSWEGKHFLQLKKPFWIDHKWRWVMCDHSRALSNLDSGQAFYWAWLGSFASYTRHASLGTIKNSSIQVHKRVKKKRQVVLWCWWGERDNVKMAKEAVKNLEGGYTWSHCSVRFHDWEPIVYNTYTYTNHTIQIHKRHFRFKYEPFNNFLVRVLTRVERQFLKVFRNYNMLTTPQRSVNLVVQYQFLNLMVGLQLLNIMVGLQL